MNIPRYDNLTVSNFTVTAWDGNTGGTLVLAAKSEITVTGTISGVGKGFVGGAKGGDWADSYQGEGTSGAGATSTTANGNGGGGGDAHSPDALPGGGGGGHGAAGTAGQNILSYSGGAGGGVAGSADLITAVFGGAGGGGTENLGGVASRGGSGGALVFMFCNNVVIDGTITNNGENGEPAVTASASGTGGGAGGGVLVVCQTATLGTGLITATAGAAGNKNGGASTGTGGAGAVGRIAVHHSGTVTGTSNPTFTDIEDSTLVESGGNAIFFGTNF